MHDEEKPFFGLPEREILDLLRVDRSTFHRWKNGKTQPPHSAVELVRIYVNGELVQGGCTWRGWRMTPQRLLLAPNGYTFTPSEVANIPYWIKSARFRHQADQEPEQFRLGF